MCICRTVVSAAAVVEATIAAATPDICDLASEQTAQSDTSALSSLYKRILRQVPVQGVTCCR